MKNLYLVFAAGLLLASCGAGGDNLDKTAKDIAAIVCKAKDAKGDEAKMKELQKEVQTIAQIAQGKQLEAAKAQKDKPEKDFMKESGQKLRDLIQAEVQKSCGVTEDELKNFMVSGKLQKTDFGPHVAEVASLTGVDMPEKDGFGAKIYVESDDKKATYWKISYVDNGKKTGGTTKHTFNYADVQLEKLNIRKEEGGVIYDYPTYVLELKARDNQPLFQEELFNVNREVQKQSVEFLFISFKTEAEANALADKIRAAFAG